MVTAVLALAALAVLFGLLLGFAAVRFRTEGDPVVDQIDALLPQTQCGQCDYAGCRPYAEAIAAGEADINHCPPGGEATIRALAELLDREPKPLDPSHGVEKAREVAVIDEDLCIGCTLCIQACPVDAILGAGKQMHTVIAPECTGCELCIEPCPVDCIDMVPVPVTIETWRWPKPASGPATRSRTTEALAEP
jgi:electron transport complex protein RnfB